MAVRTWVGGAAGDWSAGANWSGGVKPGVGDDAVIDRAGGADVTGDEDIACDNINVGETNGSNVLDVENDLDVGILRLYNQAGNKIELDGTTVGAIDCEVDDMDIRKDDGLDIIGEVDLHGPSYDSPCAVNANSHATYMDIDATADLELYWFVDAVTAQFDIPDGARVRAVRGVQFTNLADSLYCVHVAGTRYGLRGNHRNVDYSSGGRYNLGDREQNRSDLTHHGSRPATVSWSGEIVDATYKFEKDLLQYWCDTGQALHVVTRDRIIKAFITSSPWKPAGPGADPHAFDYQVEFMECD